MNFDNYKEEGNAVEIRICCHNNQRMHLCAIAPTFRGGCSQKVYASHLFSCVSGVALWAKAAAVECLRTLRLTVFLATKEEEEEEENSLYMCWALRSIFLVWVTEYGWSCMSFFTILDVLFSCLHTFECFNNWQKNSTVIAMFTENGIFYYPILNKYTSARDFKKSSWDPKLEWEAQKWMN